MKKKVLFLLFSLFILSTGCSCFGLLGKNERISDEEIFEDFTKLEKDINLTFDIEEVEIEDYKEHMKGAKDLFLVIDTNDNLYFESNSIGKDIRPITRELTGDIDSYDEKFLEEYQYFETRFTFSNTMVNFKKPKEWNDIKDWREKTGNYFYIKSIEKIKKYKYSKEEGSELGSVDSPEILLTGIKTDKIRVLVKLDIVLRRIPYTDDSARGTRVVIYDLELDLYNDNIVCKKYYTYTNNYYKGTDFEEYLYE